MSAAFAAILSMTAVVVAAYSSRRRTWTLGAISTLLILGALVSIGQPDLKANDGFMIEPVRAYAAMAIILAVGGVALVRPLAARRVGLIAASSLLALFGGHAAVVLAALLASTCSLGLVAWTARPPTMHATIPERVATILLLGADVLVGVALLIEGSGFFEPTRLNSALAAGVIGVAIFLRLIAALGLRDPLSVLAVTLPVIALLTWMPDASGIIVAVGPLAAWAAWRTVKAVNPASAVLGWISVAVCMAALGSTAAVLLVPFLLFVAVVWVTFHDVSPPMVMLAVAAPGLAAYALAESVVDQLAERGSAISLATVGLAIVLLLIGSFRFLRPVVIVESQSRKILVVLGAAALLVTTILPERVLTVIAEPISALREPGRLSEFSVSRPTGVLVVVAVGILWFLFDHGPLRVLVPASEPATPIKHEVGRVSVEEPPSLIWQRAVIASAGLAAVLVIVVLVLSASHGWL